MEVVTPVLPQKDFNFRMFQMLQFAGENGGEGRNRTVDTTIFSRMLYQLSYLATRGETAP